MGKANTTDYTLTCKKCDINETAKVVDRGSGWSGSDWNHKTKFAHFKTKWTGGGVLPPQITAAHCNKCDAAPEIVVV